MKRTFKIATLSITGIIALLLLYTGAVCSTALSFKPDFSKAQHGFLIKDRLSSPAVVLQSKISRAASFNYILTKNRKRTILQETVPVITGIEPPPAVECIEPATGYSGSLYSLLVVYHFSSRGPPL